MGNTESAAFPYKIGEEVPNTHSQHGIWKQYEGTKSATGEPVSIFSFDKQASKGQFDAQLAGNHVQRLKTLRHPHILKYHDSVDLPQVIHIVTEPVQPLHVSYDQSRASLLALALGLHQVTSALSWLNNEAKMVHSHVYPGSVYMTRTGEWKLSGFELCYKG